MSIDHTTPSPALHAAVVHDRRNGKRETRPGLTHAERHELSDRPVSALAVTGKELQLDSTVATARRLLAARAVKVLAVLDGRRYAGAVDEDTLAGAAASDPVRRLLAEDLAPVVTAETPAAEALAVLDAHGGTRLVVVDTDGATYVGVVCLRGDRRRLCVDPRRVAATAGPVRA